MKISYLVSCLLLLSACAIKPVKPWERGNLAQAVMLKNTSTEYASFETHVYTSKESSAGAAALGSGGCGCN